MLRQTGIALISAMVVIAIITAASVALASSQRLEIRRVENLIAFNRGQLALTQATLDAAEILKADVANSRADSLDEAWFVETVESKVNGDTARSRLTDLTRLYNLNNLAYGFARGSAAAATTGGASNAAANRPAGSAPNSRGAVAAPRLQANSAQPNDNSTPASNLSGSRNVSSSNLQAANPATPSVTESGLSFDDLPEQSEWNREHYVEALARKYTTACNARGQSVDACSDAFADSVNPDLAAAAVERAIEVASEPNADVTGGGQQFPTIAPSTGGRGGFTAATTPAPLEPDTSNQSPLNVPPNRPAGNSNTLSAAPARPSTTNRESVADAVETEIARLYLLANVLEIDPSIVQAIVDWVDPDSETLFPNGAEDDYYLDLEPPYRAANRPFADIRELRLVRGVTEEIFQKLRPFVTVLPEPTAVNVNTAPIEILRTLGPGIDSTIAEMVINQRRTQPFRTNEEFTEMLELMGRPLQATAITTATEYFALSAQINGERLFYHGTAVLRRNGNLVQPLEQRLEYFR